MKLERPIITVDTESTGLDTNKDRIIQIAAIKRYPDGRKEEKEYLINPTIPISPEASEVHGIYDKDVVDKPTFKQLANAMREWFYGCDISGFNTDRFDCNILIAEMEREGLSFLDWDCFFVDTMKVYREFYPNTQEAIYERFFGEKLDNAHNALADCRASDRILEKLIKDNFENDPTPEEIDLLLQGDHLRVDIGGFLYKDLEGVVRWNFSKNKDLPIRKYDSFNDWFLKQDFPLESKNKLKQVIEKL